MDYTEDIKELENAKEWAKRQFDWANKNGYQEDTKNLSVIMYALNEQIRILKEQIND